MKVKIIQIDTGAQVDALIKAGKVAEMPTIQNGWRFNFDKELKKLKNATGYLLVREDSPAVVEGCMIFQLIEKVAPYLAMIEVAPHNFGKEGKHDHVAGCLIAYAFKLSVIHGVGHYNAYLQLDVLEEHKKNEIKLMKLYETEYNAVRLSPTGTTMVIYDEKGEELVARYLPGNE